jgi:hypothetical protein
VPDEARLLDGECGVGDHGSITHTNGG